MASSESRKDMRAVVTLVARYRSPTTFEYANEVCYDVSVGGMFIQSAAPAPAGTLLKLECEADDKSDAKIRGVARVVWLRRESNENGPSGMGVKFVKLEPGSRELIESIVQRLAEAGVEARSISAAPEHQHVAGGGTTRPVQLVPSTPAEAAAPETDAAAGAETAEAELDAALERGSQSDQLGPSRADETPVGTLEPAFVAAAAAVSAEEPQPSYSATGSSRPPAPKPSRLGWRFWVFVIAVVVIGIAIADRRGRTPAETDSNPGSVTAAPEAPPSAAKAVEPEPAMPAENTEPARPAEGQPVRQAQPEMQPEPAADEPAGAVTMGEPLYPVGPGDKPYVIEFVSRPNAAIVSIDEKHTLTTPRALNMGAMPSKVKITAKKTGYQSSSIWLPRSGFELKDGAFHRRVYLTLKPEPATP